MNCRTKLLSALLLLAYYAVHAKEAYHEKRDQRSADIFRIRGCANSLLGCPTPPKHKLPTKCNKTRDCTDNLHYCHKIFRMCLPPLSKPAPPRKHSKPPHQRMCTSNEDCAINQVCHGILRTCFDRLSTSTPARTQTTRAHTILACENSTDCAPSQYCHNHFRICLSTLPVVLYPTKPTPKRGCSSDSDCGSSEFCHSLTNLCLGLLSTFPTSQDQRKAGPDFCSSDADCKRTELCHFMIGLTRSRERKGQQGQSSSAGICILNKRLQSASYSVGEQSNCSRPSSGCSDGECCLGVSWICEGYRKKGELCITEKVSFVCPCITGYECVSTGKKMGIKKLGKKLQLTKEKRAELVILKRIKFKVGKCRRKSY